MSDPQDAIIHPHRLWQVLADSGIIPPKTRRLIIDITAGEPVRLYAESFGTERLLRLDWVNALKESEPVISFADGSGGTLPAHIRFDAPGD